MNAVNKTKFNDIPSNPTTKILPNTEYISMYWFDKIGLYNILNIIEYIKVIIEKVKAKYLVNLIGAIIIKIIPKIGNKYK